MMKKVFLLCLLAVCSVASATDDSPTCDPRAISINPYKSDFFGDLITVAVDFINYGKDSVFRLHGLDSTPSKVSANGMHQFIGTVNIASLQHHANATVTFYVKSAENVSSCAISFYARSLSAVATRSANGTVEDKELPVVTVETDLNQCHSHDRNATTRNQTTCQQTVWLLKGKVQDKETGLLSIKVTPEAAKVNLPEIIVGVTDEVKFETNVTCCETELDIVATDKIGNAATVKISLASFGIRHFDIVAVSVVNCLLVLVRALLE